MLQYQEKGSCHRGDSCKFSHDVAHVSDESQESNMVVLIGSSDDDESHSSADSNSSASSSTDPSSDESESSTDSSEDESKTTQTKSILSRTVIKGSGKRAPNRGGRKGGKTVSFQDKNPNAPKPCTPDGEVCGI